ncbi:Immunoglobulin domain-containing protein [Eubacterium ruminantium]|nr:Immunoglobulin domain-containing protein [Eubacterium ruminantium]
MEKSKRQKLISLLMTFFFVVSIFSVVHGKAYAGDTEEPEENEGSLTIYDDKAYVSDYFPVYFGDAHKYQKIQYIIPAYQLDSIKDHVITKMRFYPQEAAEEKSDAVFRIYLSEISNSIFTDYTFLGTENATLVFEGNMDASEEEMDIEFNMSEYEYKGRNLLVTIQLIKRGRSADCMFYGAEKEEASLFNSSNESLTAITTGDEDIPGFIPMTTFFSYPQHEHEYTITASGAEFTAVCAVEGCYYHDHPKHIILQAPKKCFDDSEDSPEVIIKGTIPDGVVTDLSYRKGYELLDEAPTEAGTYNAVLTIDEVSAVVQYTIYKGLTVNNGTGSSVNLPVKGDDIDNYQKAQFIIPAADMARMTDKAIRVMRFFVAGTAQNPWDGATFQVYLKEVENETFADNDFIDVNDAVLVYEGALDATDSSMDVIFNRGSYDYKGGNLLVSFFVSGKDTTGSSCTASFFGTEKEGAALEGDTNTGLDALKSGTHCDFLPKIEFGAVSSHDHTFRFVANGGEIKAICTDEDCYVNEYPYKYTLKVPELLTAGSTENAEATVTGIIPGSGVPEVVYKEGDTILENAPTEAGTYTAEITYGGAKASLTYVIGTPLTVNNGTDECGEVPVKGSNGRNYQKIQYIIPADALKDMNGRGIYGMSFYLADPSQSRWESDFRIYLKEVESTTFSEDREFIAIADEDLVYEGKLDTFDAENAGVKAGTDVKKLNIRFDKAYVYNGGNLLVSVYDVTEDNNSSSAVFYGINNEDIVSIGAAGSSFDRLTNGDSEWSTFLPKTTFSYLEGTPVITSDPADTKVIRGSKAKFSIETEGTGYKYQWQNSTDGITWTDSKATGYNTKAISFKATEKLNGRLFRCAVTNSMGTVYSNPAVLTTVAVISGQPKSVKASIGDTVTFTVKSRSSVAKYQWQVSSNGGEKWSNCSGTGFDTASYAFDVKLAKYNGYLFRCKVTNGTWVEYSNEAGITITPKIITQPSAAEAYYGDLVKYYVKVSGVDPKYQWQVKTASGNWANSNSAGADSNIIRFTATKVMDGRKYRCKITDNGVTIYTEAVSLTTKNNFTSQPKNVTVKKGGTAKFTVNAAGTEGEMSYYWQYSKDDGKTWTGIKVDNSYVKTNTLNLSKVTEAQNGWMVRCRLKNRTVFTYSDPATLTVK